MDQVNGIIVSRSSFYNFNQWIQKPKILSPIVHDARVSISTLPLPIHM